LFIGTGANTLAQMLLAISRSSVESEAIITLIFVLVPVILGVLTLRIALRRKEQTGTWPRVAIFLLGAIALVAWAGLFVGPALAMLASIMPAPSSAGPKQTV
jgi:protein-S-isoprenylcysteine O-methyltransferase Ste14